MLGRYAQVLWDIQNAYTKILLILGIEQVKFRHSTVSLSPVKMTHDDDLIFTLSDHESMPESDLEADRSVAQQNDLPSNGNAKKRKRGSDNDKVMLQKKRSRSPSKLNQDNPTEESTSDNGYGEEEGAFNSDFEFEPGASRHHAVEDFDGWDLADPGTAHINPKSGNKKAVDIDEIIERRQLEKSVSTNGARLPEDRIIEDAVNSNIEQNSDAESPSFDRDDELLAEDGFGMGVASVDGEFDDLDRLSRSDTSSESHDEPSEDAQSAASPTAHPDDLTSESSLGTGSDDVTERQRQRDFFAPEEPINPKNPNHSAPDTSFHGFSLSRPILKGVGAVGFSAPTPIQAKAIPVALLGKDVVGGAVTGSGKTAAFVIPILERLLYRPRKLPTSRVAILMPTRELAVQCYNVATKLASFTDITFAQLVGGFSLREQENILKKRPDVIIATPGRFIDHMRNSSSFTVDTLEILVLDEADRMLEDGFADELNEILNTIPKSRQTMLFSATMTDSVDKLIRLGLNRPVRLMINPKKQTVSTLTQEFVRLRPGREDKRLAYLLPLCKTVYKDRVIIFFRQKKEAHRVRIIFGLCGLKAAELHGSMSQEQRISSVEKFRSGKASFLLATDVASRGLDIKGVETVLNYEAPQTHEIYLHRVGRTARAGRAGRSCTIAAEPDRKVVKAAVKSGRAHGAKIVSRIVDANEADEWAQKIGEMEAEVKAVLDEEREERHLAQAEMQVTRGDNLIKHHDEIMSRPKRTWFESEKDKMTARKAGLVELNGPVAKEKKKKKAKLSGKDKKRLDSRRDRVEGRAWKKKKEVNEAPSHGRGKTRKSKSGRK